MKRIIGILIAATFLSLTGFNEYGIAQITNAEVKVDGLSCPFCAYSLEKHLKKVDGTADVVIEVNDGKAALTASDGQSIGIEQLEEAVKKAGFTPRGMTITASGHAGEMAGETVFHIIGTDVTLTFGKNEQFNQLKKLLNGAMKTVTITGSIHKDEIKGHNGHPLILLIESYEII